MRVDTPKIIQKHNEDCKYCEKVFRSAPGEVRDNDTIDKAFESLLCKIDSNDIDAVRRHLVAWACFEGTSEFQARHKPAIAALLKYIGGKANFSDFTKYAPKRRKYLETELNRGLLLAKKAHETGNYDALSDQIGSISLELRRSVHSYGENSNEKWWEWALTIATFGLACGLLTRHDKPLDVSNMPEFDEAMKSFFAPVEAKKESVRVSAPEVGKEKIAEPTLTVNNLKPASTPAPARKFQAA
jgi:hypothetical protein